MITCAFYEKEITPPIGSEIPGYYEVRVSTGVLDRLYVKAVVFGEDRSTAAIISIDACFLPDELCRRISARVHEFTGIPAEAVGVCATHTHLGVPSGEEIGSKEDALYMEWLYRAAADCAILAAQRLRPCSFAFGTGTAEGISFVRDCIMMDGSLCTNPSRCPTPKDLSEIDRPYSQSDPLVPVLAAYDENGTPVGTLVSFACHLDCVGGTNFSGDYASVLSRRLKARYGEDFVSLFLTGACGDINHINHMTGIPLNYIDMGATLADQASEMIDGRAEKLHGKVRSLLKNAVCRYRRATSEDKANARRIVETGNAESNTMLGVLMSELLLDYEEKLERSGDTERALPVQVISVCGINIFLLPGEIYHEFAAQIRHAAGENCLFATLSNGNFGYIPIPEVFGSSVYPVQLCGGSMFEPDAGSKIVETAIELAKKLQL